MVKKDHTNWVLIMAGGRGERLRPLTDSCPKPMLLLGSRPLLEIILEGCVESGFRKFFISVNYLKNQIIDYFEGGEKWGIQIEYIQEDRPLGTAGSLALLPEFPRRPMLVVNGDVLTKVNYSDILQFHDEHRALATICVRQHETKIPYGVVKTSGVDVSGVEEKPTHAEYVNAGVYVISPSFLRLMEKGEQYDMPDLLISAIKAQNKVVAFPLHEYWLDVGHPDSLQQATGDLT